MGPASGQHRYHWGTMLTPANHSGVMSGTWQPHTESARSHSSRSRFVAAHKSARTVLLREADKRKPQRCVSSYFRTATCQQAQHTSYQWRRRIQTQHVAQFIPACLRELEAKYIHGLLHVLAAVKWICVNVHVPALRVPHTHVEVY